MSHFALRHLTVPGPDRVGAIDGLRAVSVLWMMSFHVVFMAGLFVPSPSYIALVQHPLLLPMAQGHFGVDVFFVISGYLIGAMLLREHQRTGTLRVRRFYLRRAFRILPAYLTLLVLAGVILQEDAHLQTAWANVLFVNNFLPLDDQSIVWAWSLAIEAQFYLVFPLVLLVFHRPGPDPRASARRLLPWLWALLAVAFSILAALVFGLGMEYPNPFHWAVDPVAFRRYFDAIYDKPYGRYGGILCGIIVAALELAETPLDWLNRHLARARLLIVGSLIGLVAFATRPIYRPTGERPGPLWEAIGTVTYRYVFAMLVAYLILYVLARARARATSRTSRLLSSRLWRPFAELSYGAYLLHPLVVMVLMSHFEPAALSAATVLWLVGASELVTFCAAWVLYGAVERPLREWGRMLAAGKASLGSSAPLAPV